LLHNAAGCVLRLLEAHSNRAIGPRVVKLMAAVASEHYFDA
jgi:hypothetical protein